MRQCRQNKYAVVMSAIISLVTQNENEQSSIWKVEYVFQLCGVESV